MAVLLAAFTSDPNLLPCELHRLHDSVGFEDAPPRAATGLAWYSQDDVLQRRFPAESPPPSTRELLPSDPSDAVLFHRREISASASVEENTQPFKFRRWLFAHDGSVSGWPASRLSTVSALPDHLQRAIRGDLDSEVLFALFLKELRDVGRTEDLRLPPELAARSLLQSAAVMDRLAREAGATAPSDLRVVATNGRMLLAARTGPTPLFYRLLEGHSLCERCGLDAKTPVSDSRIPAHRRVRTVVVTSAPKGSGAWLELEDGEALAVDLKLTGRKLRL